MRTFILVAILSLVLGHVSSADGDSSSSSTTLSANKLLADAIKKLTYDGDLVLALVNGIPQVVSRASLNVTSSKFDAAEDVILNLYTQSNPTVATTININDQNSFGSYNPSHETKVVIHGWQSTAKSMDRIRADYIATGKEYNIVMVDWSKAASNILYNEAKDAVAPTGEVVGKLCDVLISNGQDPGSIHIVGHSLGAHVSGVAGNRCSYTIGRVTGMDPAGPLYGSGNEADRLDISDASFVEVIHTCGGLLGWEDALGHADFKPNGGKSPQPGCGIDIAGTCSHGRSHEYFAESIISNKGFLGETCNDWGTFENGGCTRNPSALMGDPTSLSASGVYYLTTNDQSPYAQG